MYSASDFEKLWFLYKTDGAPLLPIYNPLSVYTRSTVWVAPVRSLDVKWSMLPAVTTIKTTLMARRIA